MKHHSHLKHWRCRSTSDALPTHCSTFHKSGMQSKELKVSMPFRASIRHAKACWHQEAHPEVALALPLSRHVAFQVGAQGI